MSGLKSRRVGVSSQVAGLAGEEGGLASQEATASAQVATAQSELSAARAEESSASNKVSAAQGVIRSAQAGIATAKAANDAAAAAFQTGGDAPNAAPSDTPVAPGEPNAAKPAAPQGGGRTFRPRPIDTSALTAAQGQLSTAQGLLSNARARAATAQGHHATAQSTRATIASKRSEVRGRLTIVQGELASADSEIGALSSQVASLKATLDGARASAEAARAAQEIESRRQAEQAAAEEAKLEQARLEEAKAKEEATDAIREEVDAKFDANAPEEGETAEAIPEAQQANPGEEGGFLDTLEPPYIHKEEPAPQDERSLPWWAEPGLSENMEPREEADTGTPRERSEQEPKAALDALGGERLFAADPVSVLDQISTKQVGVEPHLEKNLELTSAIAPVELFEELHAANEVLGDGFGAATVRTAVEAVAEFIELPKGKSPQTLAQADATTADMDLDTLSRLPDVLRETTLQSMPPKRALDALGGKQAFAADPIAALDLLRTKRPAIQPQLEEQLKRVTAVAPVEVFEGLHKANERAEDGFGTTTIRTALKAVSSSDGGVPRAAASIVDPWMTRPVAALALKNAASFKPLDSLLRTESIPDMLSTSGNTGIAGGIPPEVLASIAAPSLSELVGGSASNKGGFDFKKAAGAVPSKGGYGLKKASGASPAVAGLDLGRLAVSGQIGATGPTSGIDRIAALLSGTAADGGVDGSLLKTVAGPGTSGNTGIAGGVPRELLASLSPSLFKLAGIATSAKGSFDLDKLTASGDTPAWAASDSIRAAIATGEINADVLLRDLPVGLADTLPEGLLDAIGTALPDFGSTGDAGVGSLLEMVQDPTPGTLIADIVLGATTLANTPTAGASARVSPLSLLGATQEQIKQAVQTMEAKGLAQQAAEALVHQLAPPAEEQDPALEAQPTPDVAVDATTMQADQEAPAGPIDAAFDEEIRRALEWIPEEQQGQFLATLPPETLSYLSEEQQAAALEHVPIASIGQLAPELQSAAIEHVPVADLLELPEDLQVQAAILNVEPGNLLEIPLELRQIASQYLGPEATIEALGGPEAVAADPVAALQQLRPTVQTQHDAVVEAMKLDPLPEGFDPAIPMAAQMDLVLADAHGEFEGMSNATALGELAINGLIDVDTLLASVPPSEMGDLPQQVQAKVIDLVPTEELLELPVELLSHALASRPPEETYELLGGLEGMEADPKAILELVGYKPTVAETDADGAPIDATTTAAAEQTAMEEMTATTALGMLIDRGILPVDSLAGVEPAAFGELPTNVQIYAIDDLDTERLLELPPELLGIAVGRRPVEETIELFGGFEAVEADPSAVLALLGTTAEGEGATSIPTEEAIGLLVEKGLLPLHSVLRTVEPGAYAQLPEEVRLAAVAQLEPSDLLLLPDDLRNRELLRRPADETIEAFGGLEEVEADPLAILQLLEGDLGTGSADSLEPTGTLSESQAIAKLISLGVLPGDSFDKVEPGDFGALPYSARGPAYQSLSNDQTMALPMDLRDEALRSRDPKENVALLGGVDVVMSDPIAALATFSGVDVATAEEATAELARRGLLPADHLSDTAAEMFVERRRADRSDDLETRLGAENYLVLEGMLAEDIDAMFGEVPEGASEEEAAQLLARKQDMVLNHMETMLAQNAADVDDMVKDVAAMRTEMLEPLIAADNNLGTDIETQRVLMSADKRDGILQDTHIRAEQLGSEDQTTEILLPAGSLSEMDITQVGDSLVIDTGNGITTIDGYFDPAHKNHVKLILGDAEGSDAQRSLYGSGIDAYLDRQKQGAVFEDLSKAVGTDDTAFLNDLHGSRYGTSAVSMDADGNFVFENRRDTTELDDQRNTVTRTVTKHQATLSYDPATQTVTDEKGQVHPVGPALAAKLQGALQVGPMENAAHANTRGFEDFYQQMYANGEQAAFGEDGTISGKDRKAFRKLTDQVDDKLQEENPVDWGFSNGEEDYEVWSGGDGGDHETRHRDRGAGFQHGSNWIQVGQAVGAGVVNDMWHKMPEDDRRETYKQLTKKKKWYQKLVPVLAIAALAIPVLGPVAFGLSTMATAAASGLMMAASVKLGGGSWGDALKAGIIQGASTYLSLGKPLGNSYLNAAANGALSEAAKGGDFKDILVGAGVGAFNAWANGASSPAGKFLGEHGMTLDVTPDGLSVGTASGVGVKLEGGEIDASFTKKISNFSFNLNTDGDVGVSLAQDKDGGLGLSVTGNLSDQQWALAAQFAMDNGMSLSVTGNSKGDWSLGASDKGDFGVSYGETNGIGSFSGTLYSEDGGSVSAHYAEDGSYGVSKMDQNAESQDTAFLEVGADGAITMGTQVVLANDKGRFPNGAVSNPDGSITSEDGMVTPQGHYQGQVTVGPNGVSASGGVLRSDGSSLLGEVQIRPDGSTTASGGMTRADGAEFSGEVNVSSDGSISASGGIVRADGTALNGRVSVGADGTTTASGGMKTADGIVYHGEVTQRPDGSISASGGFTLPTSMGGGSHSAAVDVTADGSVSYALTGFKPNVPPIPPPPPDDFRDRSSTTGSLAEGQNNGPIVDDHRPQGPGANQHGSNAPQEAPTTGQEERDIAPDGVDHDQANASGTGAEEIESAGGSTTVDHDEANGRATDAGPIIGEGEEEDSDPSSTLTEEERAELEQTEQAEQHRAEAREANEADLNENVVTNAVREKFPGWTDAQIRAFWESHRDHPESFWSVSGGLTGTPMPQSDDPETAWRQQQELQLAKGEVPEELLQHAPPGLTKDEILNLWRTRPSYLWTLMNGTADRSDELDIAELELELDGLTEEQARALRASGVDLTDYLANSRAGFPAGGTYPLIPGERTPTTPTNPDGVLLGPPGSPVQQEAEYLMSLGLSMKEIQSALEMSGLNALVAMRPTGEVRTLSGRNAVHQRAESGPPIHPLVLQSRGNDIATGLGFAGPYGAGFGAAVKILTAPTLEIGVREAAAYATDQVVGLITKGIATAGKAKMIAEAVGPVFADWIKSKITGEEFNLDASIGSNAAASAFKGVVITDEMIGNASGQMAIFLKALQNAAESSAKAVAGAGSPADPSLPGP